MTCLACTAGLHEECAEPLVVNVETVDEALQMPNTTVADCCCYSGTPTEVPVEVVIGRVEKRPEEMDDPISTGRKRAAKLKPIIEGMTCEWAWLANAGGGAIPIKGCEGTTLTREKGNEGRTGNIHHGPDKDVLNNTDENLHRICGFCHNRWHALNDPLYPKERPTPGTPFIPLSGKVIPHDKYTRYEKEETSD